MTKHNSDDTSIVLVSGLLSLVMLLVQYPTRKIFKLLFHREPVYKQATKFSDHLPLDDLLYLLIILLVPVFSVFTIISLIK